MRQFLYRWISSPAVMAATVPLYFDTSVLDAL
jgi:hypothetical protein